VWSRGIMLFLKKGMAKHIVYFVVYLTSVWQV
jgi:hypothetical protein